MTFNRFWEKLLFRSHSTESDYSCFLGHIKQILTTDSNRRCFLGHIQILTEVALGDIQQILTELTLGDIQQILT